MRSKLTAAVAGAVLILSVSAASHAQAVEAADASREARIAAMPSAVHAQWRGHHGWRGGHGWGHRRVVVHRGYGWGYRPYWGPRRVVYGPRWGYRPYWHRPAFYRPVVVAGVGWCRWERRVRWSWRLQSYVMRRVQICY